MRDFISLKGQHSNELQFITDCLNCNIPLLVVTNHPQRLVQSLQTLSKISGQKLNRILLNERSDTSQLLGCFEQTASDIQGLLKELEVIKEDAVSQTLIADITQLEYGLKQNHGNQAL